MSWRAFVAGIVALCLSGCADLFGVEDLPPSPCKGCVATACGEEADACSADEACRAFASCLARCRVDDSACRADCEQIRPATKVADEFDDCRRAQCREDCLGSKGMIAAVDTAECAECVEFECFAELVGCLEDASAEGQCERRWWCATHGGRIDPARTMGCDDGFQFPDGIDSNLDWCRVASCPDKCSFGRRWACVRGYDWPALEAPKTIEYEVFPVTTISGFATFLTVGGATITACRRDDCADCAEPIDSAVVPDESQGVVLDLEVPFEGCFRIEGEGYEPTLHYGGRPILGPETWPRIGVMPTAALEIWKDSTRQAQREDRGLVFFQVHDCLGDTATDLTVTVSGTDEDSVVAYVAGNYWWPETGPDRTSQFGRGGVVNVEPGTQTIEARRQDGTLVASQDILVKAGWVTNVWLYPMTSN